MNPTFNQLINKEIKANCIELNNSKLKPMMGHDKETNSHHQLQHIQYFNTEWVCWDAQLWQCIHIIACTDLVYMYLPNLVSICFLSSEKMWTVVKYWHTQNFQLEKYPI